MLIKRWLGGSAMATPEGAICATELHDAAGTGRLPLASVRYFGYFGKGCSRVSRPMTSAMMLRMMKQVMIAAPLLNPPK
jgi:hypothetical protein